MSNDNKNSEQPFDFDFDALNEDESREKTGDSAFDLDNPFGDDVVVTRGEPGKPLEQSGESFDLENPFGDDLAPRSEMDMNTDSGFLADSSDRSAENYLGENNWEEDSAVGESSEISEGEVPAIDASEEETGKKKKGFLGGLFGGGKKKAPKEKKTKEKQPKAKKEKKEKAPKDGESTDKPTVPRDWGTILCVAFSVFLLVSLLMFNVATLLTSGDSILGTLTFLGAFNLVGLALVAVPILFYKFPQERTLPNVMLGLSVGAMFTGVLFHVNNFYQYYGFAISP
jgi:hypothetical protein